MSVRLFAYTVAFAGFTVAATSARTVRLDSIDPLMLAILVTLAAVTQRMPVFLFRLPDEYYAYCVKAGAFNMATAKKSKAKK